MNRQRLILAGATVVCLVIGAAVAALLAPSSDAGSKVIPSALPSISVFSQPSASQAEPQLENLLDLPNQKADFDKLHVLGSELGAKNSRLVAFPSESGQVVCYALLGFTPADPGMSYCYAPYDPGLPDGIKGEHFSAVALYSAAGGEPRVQLFGIAFDDVVKVRVQAAGEWKSVPLNNNGLYLDLPGLMHEQVGIVEATLADGTVQVHDIQAGA